MDTFFRDLLHEKVSRKISVKAPKQEGEFFVAVLPPDKHPSSCQSKDFFWMKASGKHTVRQLREIYQEKKNLQIKFSDGDKTIGDSSRISSLNHFGDEVIVVWAQESVSTLPSVSIDEIRSPLPTSKTHTSEPPADTGLEGSVSPAKRRTESPSVSASRKKQRDASPREDIRQFFKPKSNQAKTESKSESLAQNRLAENTSHLHDNATDNAASAPALSPSVSESEAAPQSSHLSISASPHNGISQNSSPRTPEDAIFKRREQTAPLPDATLKQEPQSLTRSKSISDLLEIDNSINTTIRLHSQLQRPE